MSVRLAEFEFVRRLVRERIGIALGEDHAYLVESRLAPMARDEGCDSVAEFIGLLMAGRREELQVRVAEALATHETSFFRDPAMFDVLGTVVLPMVLAKRGEGVIWSAACSTGQEPLSVAMLASGLFPELSPDRIRVIASDVSQETLARARRGRFGQLEVNRGLPANQLVRWFTRQGTEWQAKAELCQRIEWRLFNLIGSFEQAPRADVILLRNVMIYFEEASRKRILHSMHRCLAPDGWLFLGAAEMPNHTDSPFRMERHGSVTAWRPL
jgi:chemotaxis protein methyltransferase CheR